MSSISFGQQNQLMSPRESVSNNSSFSCDFREADALAQLLWENSQDEQQVPPTSGIEQYLNEQDETNATVSTQHQPLLLGGVMHLNETTNSSPRAPGGESINFTTQVNPDDDPPLHSPHEKIEDVTGLTAEQQRLIYPTHHHRPSSHSALMGNNGGGGGSTISNVLGGGVASASAATPPIDNTTTATTTTQVHDVNGLCDQQTIHLVPRRKRNNIIAASPAAASSNTNNNGGHSPTSAGSGVGGGNGIGSLLGGPAIGTITTGGGGSGGELGLGRIGFHQFVSENEHRPNESRCPPSGEAGNNYKANAEVQLTREELLLAENEQNPNQSQGNDASTTSQLFSGIIQDFREQRHYDRYPLEGNPPRQCDQEETGFDQLPGMITSDQSADAPSPAPRASCIERRQGEAKYPMVSPQIDGTKNSENKIAQIQVTTHANPEGQDTEGAVEDLRRMSQLVSEDEHNPYPSCSSPESVDEDIQEVQLIGDVYHPKKDDRASQTTFSQLFSEILQGFRDNRHYYEEEEEEGPGYFSVASLLSVSPAPLAPDVELRHQRANALLRASTQLNDEVGKVNAISDGGTSGESCCSPAANEQRLPEDVQKERKAKTPAAATQLPSSQEVDRTRPKQVNTLRNEAPSNGNPDLKTKTSSEELKLGVNSRNKRKLQAPNSGSENIQVVGMGFFSQLQETGLYDQVVGITGKKKKKKIQKRRRKKKTDLLEGVSMGFFSGQMSAPSTTSTKPRELSDRVAPLYDWAPVMDERTRTAAEFSLPVVLPAVAMFFQYTSFAWVYCLALPIIHTLEVLLTNFGPKASHLQFRYTPINPMMHMCCDLVLLHPICMMTFIRPEAFGPYAYIHGGILFVLEYIYWAVSYKNVVVRRKAKVK